MKKISQLIEEKLPAAGVAVEQLDDIIDLARDLTDAAEIVADVIEGAPDAYPIDELNRLSDFLQDFREDLAGSVSMFNEFLDQM